MINQGESQALVSKKTFEICYIVLVRAKETKDAIFRTHLEDQALKLVEFVLSSDYQNARIAMNSISYIWKLACDIGTTHSSNQDLIFAGLLDLNSAIAELEKSDIYDISNLNLPVRVDNASLESGNESGNFNTIAGLGITSKTEDNDTSIKPELETDQIKIPEGLSITNQSSLENIRKNFVSSKDRQDKILKFIEERSICRLRDIQEFIPGLSERTIRYDLQNLMERELISRVGTGGPGTYYKRLA
jgi:hypothetical protein